MDTYHTCAGCNDAVFPPDHKRIAGYLVGDVQYFDYDGQNETYGFGFIPTDEGVEQGFWFVDLLSILVVPHQNQKW